MIRTQLGSSSIVLAALTKKSEVRNVIITGNMHHTGNTGNSSFFVDERLGSFTSIEDVVIENNGVDKTDAAANKTGTRATLSAPLSAGATGATLYFTKYLMFTTPIDPSSIRCWLYGPHATALSVQRQYDFAVQVTLQEAVPAEASGAMVTCSVDQSARACPAH